MEILQQRVVAFVQATIVLCLVGMCSFAFAVVAVNQERIVMVNYDN